MGRQGNFRIGRLYHARVINVKKQLLLACLKIKYYLCLRFLIDYDL